jgi:hypothetical protein
MAPRSCSGFLPHPPAPQAVQETSVGCAWLVPGAQAVQVVAPSALRVSRPLGHRVHTLVAYSEGRNVREAQGVHSVAP